MFVHNGPHVGISKPLQRVASLRRCAQANVRATSYWLRRVQMAGAETRRVHRARGAGGGACYTL